MDQTQQPKANFIGFKNRYKQSNDERPNFTGRIGLPGTDREFRTALWAGKDSKGNVMFTGRASEMAQNDDALTQIGTMAGNVDAKMLEENGIKLAPGQIVIFKNGFRDEANPSRPHFYGRWNPGTGEKLVDISVWARESRSGDALLTGQTQYRIPGKTAAMSEMSPDELNTVEQGGEGVAMEGERRGRRSRSSSR